MVEAIRQGDIPGVQLRRRQELGMSVEAAWGWLTEPGKLRRWLAEEVEVEPGPRGHLLLRGTDETGAPLQEEGRTLEFAPPRRWVLAFERSAAGWPVATRLTLELTGQPGGCEFSVLQEGFQHLPLSTCLTIWEAYRRRWRTAVEKLAEVSSAGL